MTQPSPWQWSIFEVGLDSDGVRTAHRSRRPVLVVSRETANAVLPIVTVLPLAIHRPGRRIYPNEVLLPSKVAGLESDTVAMAHQTLTLPKQDLAAPVGSLRDPKVRSAVRRAMRVQLNLDESTEGQVSNPRES